MNKITRAAVTITESVTTPAAASNERALPKNAVSFVVLPACGKPVSTDKFVSALDAVCATRGGSERDAIEGDGVRAGRDAAPKEFFFIFGEGEGDGV